MAAATASAAAAAAAAALSNGNVDAVLDNDDVGAVAAGNACRLVACGCGGGREGPPPPPALY